MAEVDLMMFSMDCSSTLQKREDAIQNDNVWFILEMFDGRKILKQGNNMYTFLNVMNMSANLEVCSIISRIF